MPAGLRLAGVIIISEHVTCTHKGDTINLFPRNGSVVNMGAGSMVPLNKQIGSASK